MYVNYVYRTVLVGAPTTPEDEENASPYVAPSGHQKRRKVSAASFFTPRVAQVSPVRRQQDRLLLHVSLKRIIRMKMNCLVVYLALPQINYETEWDALDWW